MSTRDSRCGHTDLKKSVSECVSQSARSLIGRFGPIWNDYLLNKQNENVKVTKETFLDNFLNTEDDRKFWGFLSHNAVNLRIIGQSTNNASGHIHMQSIELHWLTLKFVFQLNGQKLR